MRANSRVERAAAEAPGAGRHPVIVVPGFLAADLSTALLRAYLSHHGYHALPWGFGQNRGPVDDLLAKLIARVREQAHASRQRVSLIGHSLGGIYVREIAKAAPDCVRMVITLASPFRSTHEVVACPSMVRLIERVTRRSLDELLGSGVCGDIDAPAPVPSIAFYSKADRVAHWRACMEVESALTENIEVRTSHQRMVINATVFREARRRLDARSGCERSYIGLQSFDAVGAVAAAG